MQWKYWVEVSKTNKSSTYLPQWYCRPVPQCIAIDKPWSNKANQKHTSNNSHQCLTQQHMGVSEMMYSTKIVKKYGEWFIIKCGFFNYQKHPHTYIYIYICIATFNKIEQSNPTKITIVRARICVYFLWGLLYLCHGIHSHFRSWEKYMPGQTRLIHNSEICQFGDDSFKRGRDVMSL